MPGPTVTVHPSDSTPQSCTMNPDGEIHAPKKSQNGFVNFNATAPCTINFSNSAVFGMGSKPLNQGNNQINVDADPLDGKEVRTNVSIEGCPSGGKKLRTMSVGSASVFSGPADIIVP